MSSSTATEARVLGDFVLGDKLGEGGFGAVYHAQQRALERPAVIKVIRPTLAMRPEAVERFVLEAKLASRFDHPYAAHIYAFGAEPDGLMWIAMELVRGTPLGELVSRSGPLPLDRFVPLMERLCEVIQSAHDQGIVHRDIKPSNVMIVARSGRLLPKLLDFGIAKAIAPDLPQPSLRPKRATASGRVPAHTPVELDQTAQAVTGSSAERPREEGITIEGQILGSPHYMAPEQWVDASSVGPWTDQYALAMLAYEVLTGAKAYQGTTISQLAASHVNDPLPELPPEIPTAVHAVLARASAKEPSARYASVTELAAALRTAIAPGNDVDERVELPSDLLAAWIADAPRPISEAITALAAARSPVRVADRAAAVGRTIAHWFGALAIACRSRLGKLDATTDVELIRQLRSRALRDDESLDLAAALTRPFASRPEAWPVPELVSFLAGDTAPTLRALVRGDTSPFVVGATTSIEHQTATAKVAQLQAVLRAAGWLLDYEVVREINRGRELWMGPASDEPIVHAGQAEQPGRVVLLDADGARVAALSPAIRIAAPAAGEREQTFVLAGPGRSPELARYVAPPHGFAYEVDDLWGWLGEHVLEVAAGAARVADDERPPYPGLAAFTADDRASFVGREREIEQVVNRLRAHPMIAVVGPSGVGKSSFLAAGVVPALPTGWVAEVVRPGDNPVAAVAAIVNRRAASPYRDARRAPVARTPEALAEALIAAAHQRAETLVIVVDQAEELFTMCADEARRIELAAVLAAATRDPAVRVVLGLRDDFLCRIEDLAPWRETFARAVQMLRIPGVADLERIVAVPARRRGYELDDPSLAREIATELEGRPGALPLVAFAATELWEQRDRHFRKLTRAAYERIGGVRGALVQHADGVVDGLTAPDRRLVRLAFRRLLSADGTRALIGRAELIAALGGTPAAAKVIERLLSARLIVSRDDDDGERVEIGHEALVTAWPRLADWRREDDADVRIQQQLATAARHWDERGRATGLLWSGDALSDLRRWRARTELAMTPVEAAFADASERAWRSARRRKVGALGTAFVALGAGVVVLGSMNKVVTRQRTEAVHRLAASLEERGRLAVEADDAAHGLLYLTEARKLGATGPGADLLVARATAAIESQTALLSHQQGAIADVGFDSVTAIVRDQMFGAQLWDRASRTRIGPTLTEVEDVVPVGGDVAIVSETGDVSVMGRDGAPRWHVAHAHGEDAIERERGIRASAAGRVVVSFGDTAKLWNLDDGAPRGELRHDGARITAVALDASGTHVATADRAGGVRVWNAMTGAPIAACGGHGAWVRVLAFSPDGRLLASSGADRAIVVCDAATGAVVQRFEGHDSDVVDLEVSGDGHALASAGRDGSVRVWDLAAGRQRVLLHGHHGTVPIARFSPDDRYVLSAGMDGTVRIWDAIGGTQLALLQGGAAIPFADWEPGGRAVLTAGNDGTLREWDVARALRGSASQQHTGAVVDLAISPDSRWSASAASDGVVLRDLRDDATRVTLPVKGAAMVRFAPDGATLIVADDAGAAIWSVPDGALVRRLGTTAVSAAEPSPDGRTIATGGPDGMLRLYHRDGTRRAELAIGFAPEELRFDPASRWVIAHGDYGNRAATEAPVIDLASNAVVAHLRGDHTAPWVVATSATRVATNDGNDIALWDAATWRRIAVLRGHKAICTQLAFLPDGRLVSAGEDRATLVWTAAGELAASLPTAGTRLGPSAIAATPDGALFATGGQDGVVRIWDGASYRELSALASHLGMASVVRITPDGQHVLSAGFDGRVVAWDLRRPTRSLAELTELVRCRVPYEFDGEDALPRDLDFDDPRCR